MTLAIQLRKAELEKQIREQNQWTYTNEQKILEAKAKDTTSNQNFTDIFKQQASINQSLIEVLTKVGSAGDTNPTYVTAQMPAAQDTAPKTNYVYWIAGIVAVYFFFIKGRKK